MFHGGLTNQLSRRSALRGSLAGPTIRNRRSTPWNVFATITGCADASTSSVPGARVPIPRSAKRCCGQCAETRPPERQSRHRDCRECRRRSAIPRRCRHTRSPACACTADFDIAQHDVRISDHDAGAERRGGIPFDAKPGKVASLTSKAMTAASVSEAPPGSRSDGAARHPAGHPHTRLSRICSRYSPGSTMTSMPASALAMAAAIDWS